MCSSDLCFSGTDNPTFLFTEYYIRFRPRMDDKQNDIANQSKRLPAVTIWVWIRTAQCQRIVKH